MSYHIDTVAAHAGRVQPGTSTPVTAPISLASTFLQEAPGQYDTHAYARIGNPNRDALERTLALLEGGGDAAAFASGCAAMHAALQLLAPGDHLVACGSRDHTFYRRPDTASASFSRQIGRASCRERC